MRVATPLPWELHPWLPNPRWICGCAGTLAHHWLAAEAGSVGDAHGIRGPRVETGPLRHVEKTIKSPKTGALKMLTPA